VFENLLTQIMVRMEDAGNLKRRMFRYFLGVARRCGEAILNRQAVGAKDRLLYRLGDILVYGPLRNRMGLSRTRVAYTAGEAIGPELFRFYRSLGVNLKQLYGQTEASVYITLQPDGEVYSDTVGRPGTDIEIKIADNGEVLFKSPGVFLKYYKNDEAPPRRRTGGCAPAMPASSTTAVTSRSSTAPRMSAGSPTGRCMRQSIWKTASSSTPR
jgi:long-chain acyl-CoA synthetase